MMKMKIGILLLLQTALVFAQINFDANFESGNLAQVEDKGDNYFEVRSKEDIGGRWFYFKMTGVKNQFVKVKVLNSDANRPVYSYDNESFVRFTEEESPYVNYFEKTYTEDTVYIAYYTPYTFTHLMQKINVWKKSNYVEADTLGYTQMNLPMQEIILTDPYEPNENKLHVWIHARTHPGETPSSFQFEGIVEELLKDDDVIDFYRKSVVFHLIPFTNPDGVYYGRSRTNYNYVDVEREWDKPMAETCLEVQALKRRMDEINSEKVLSVFLNLHSQTSPSCTFWIHSPSSTSDRFYRMEHQFANLNVSDNPYFVKEDFSESNLRSYFPEGYLWNNFGEQVMALTYETPYDHYSTDIWVTNDNLREIGKRTLYASMEYLGLSHPKRFIMDDASAQYIGDWQTDSTGFEFYGKGFHTTAPGFGTNKVSYQSQSLQPGKYDVYAWWPTDDSFAYNTQFNISANGEEINLTKTQRTNGAQWNYLTQAELQRTGTITITLQDKSSGIVAADAFRIIYAGVATSVKRDDYQLSSFELLQNYPNPFNPETKINFVLNKSGSASLVLYDVLGRKVATLFNGYLSAGNHSLSLNIEEYSLSSGVYFYTLSFNGKSLTKKMTVLK